MMTGSYCHRKLTGSSWSPKYTCSSTIQHGHHSDYHLYISAAPAHANVIKILVGELFEVEN
jgi:hypothetical protein